MEINDFRHYLSTDEKQRYAAPRTIVYILKIIHCMRQLIILIENLPLDSNVFAVFNFRGAIP